METIRDELKLFNTIIKEMDSLYGELAHRSGLTDSAFWVLYYLTQMDQTITQKTICNQWFLSKQTVNNAIFGLQKKGYISLLESQEDKRSKQISLTKLGEEFTKTHIESIFCMEESIFLQMSKSQRDNLLSSNTRYLQLLRIQINKKNTRAL